MSVRLGIRVNVCFEGRSLGECEAGVKMRVRFRVSVMFGVIVDVRMNVRVRVDQKPPIECVVVAEWSLTAQRLVTIAENGFGRKEDFGTAAVTS